MRKRIKAWLVGFAIATTPAFAFAQVALEGVYNPGLITSTDTCVGCMTITTAEGAPLFPRRFLVPYSGVAPQSWQILSTIPTLATTPAVSMQLEVYSEDLVALPDPFCLGICINAVLDGQVTALQEDFTPGGNCIATSVTPVSTANGRRVTGILDLPVTITDAAGNPCLLDTCAGAGLLATMYRFHDGTLCAIVGDVYDTDITIGRLNIRYNQTEDD